MPDVPTYACALCATALWYALAAYVVFARAPRLTRGERVVAWALSPLVFPASLARPCAAWLAAYIDGPGPETPADAVTIAVHLAVDDRGDYGMGDTRENAEDDYSDCFGGRHDTLRHVTLEVVIDGETASVEEKPCP